jgi:prepilin-type N-terminal cleavage/methylation domain-containing protein
MPIHTKKNLRAFTLIEVLVVVAIMGIMTGVAVMSFGNGRTDKELETSAREFVAVAREVQNYALTGRQFSTTDTDACADGFRFRLRWNDNTTAHNDYHLRYRHNVSGSCTGDIVASYTLKNGVVFSGSASSIFFTMPWANIFNNSGTALELATPNYVTVTLTKSSRSHVVCIYADGRITNKAGASCS